MVKSEKMDRMTLEDYRGAIDIPKPNRAGPWQLYAWAALESQILDFGSWSP
jgi:hypothetical protein